MDFEDGIPVSFLCPISREIMLSPVMTVNCQTYDRKSIEEWFRRGKKRDPMSNEELASQTLKPNYALKSAIREFLERRVIEEKAADRKKKSVDELLADLKLTDFSDKFTSQGFDSLEALSTLSIEDLLNMGLKLGHGRSLIKRVAGLSLEVEEEKKAEKAQREKQIADNSRAEEQYLLGQAAEKANPSNWPKAFEYYTQAMKLGHQQAAVKVAVCYIFGLGCANIDYKKARAILEEAKNYDKEANLWLGYCYGFGKGVTRDAKAGVELLLDKECPKSRFLAGVCYHRGGVDFKSDLIRAEELYRLAVSGLDEEAKRGDSISQFLLGMSYAHGAGVHKDQAEACYWYESSAFQGLADAQYNIGVCYQDGKGVHKDEARAVEYYLLAAEQGHGTAQAILGWCYLEKIGISEASGAGDEQKKALYLWKSAADMGNRVAQYSLGVCYEEGKGGLPVDKEQAILWYAKAAEQDFDKARCRISRMLRGPIAVIDQPQQPGSKA